MLVGNFICLDFKQGFPTNLVQRETNNLATFVTQDLEVNSPQISLWAALFLFPNILNLTW